MKSFVHWKLYCLLLCIFMLTACGGGGGGGGNTGTGSGTPAPVPTAKAAWTFMVYLDADNDLDPYASGDLAEMMAVGSSARVNIIVQYDGYQKPAYRYKVEKGSLTTLTNLGEVNMASAQALTDFISFAASNYPAERYALVLWNHGQGWKSGSAAKQALSILSDWDSNGVKSAPLDNSLVAKGIAGGGVTIDVLGVDACNMATLEAACEFSSVAGYMVASQELVQIKGWDYRDVLTRLTANPDMTGDGLARAAVDSYRTQMNNSGLTDQTMSAIRLADISAVVTAVDSMARSLKDGISDPAILAQITRARGAVQEFDPYVDANTYVDLTHLATLITGSAAPVTAAIGKAVIDEYHGPSRANAHGLSIAFFNLPVMYTSSNSLKMSLYDPTYINLGATRVNPAAFLDTTTWGRFLDSYYTLQYPDIYSKMRTWKYLAQI
ncbi:MAG: clostripain-related cysteine peptidase [Desulfuromonadales bacterium]